jgi:CheY-like chemotaxis protein
MFKLPIFYYPSTIAWIDDDALFLKSTSQILLSNSFKTFVNPHECLKFFETYTPPLSKMNFLRDCIEHEYYETVNHSPVDFNVPALHNLHNMPERSQEISVIIVDYEMPEMNGIELCQKLRSLPFKKILLTGEADHQEAVSAFNNNTIDRFISKDSPTLVADIQTHVAALTEQYFCDRTYALLSHIEADHPSPLSDPTFIDFFRHWCNTHDIKEYTLIDKNGSFLAITADNKCLYFIIHTDRSINSFIKFNDDTHDAEFLINALKQREKIPFFGVGKESWQFEIPEWPNHFYLSNNLIGREKYYWSVVAA